MLITTAGGVESEFWRTNPNPIVRTRIKYIEFVCVKSKTTERRAHTRHCGAIDARNDRDATCSCHTDAGGRGEARVGRPRWKPTWGAATTDDGFPSDETRRRHDNTTFRRRARFRRRRAARHDCRNQTVRNVSGRSRNPRFRHETDFFLFTCRRSHASANKRRSLSRGAHRSAGGYCPYRRRG